LDVCRLTKWTVKLSYTGLEEPFVAFRDREEGPTFAEGVAEEPADADGCPEIPAEPFSALIEGEVAATAAEAVDDVVADDGGGGGGRSPSDLVVAVAGGGVIKLILLMSAELTDSPGAVVFPLIPVVVLALPAVLVALAPLSSLGLASSLAACFPFFPFPTKKK